MSLVWFCGAAADYSALVANSQTLNSMWTKPCASGAIRATLLADGSEYRRQDVPLASAVDREATGTQRDGFLFQIKRCAARGRAGVRGRAERAEFVDGRAPLN
jgi:hypothetical protein